MTIQDTSANNRKDHLAEVLEWDVGTAYDLLLSLHAIFRPKEHGLPAPWAAGVRKRLPPRSQQDLKDFYGSSLSYLAYTPLHLVLEMPPPKDSLHFLDYIEAIPDEQFSRRMYRPITRNERVARIVARALGGEVIGDAEVEEFRREVGRSPMALVTSPAEVRRLFADVADPAATKRRWLHVMREYYEAFFAEEEKREQSALEQMLAHAQALARTTTVPDLIERISNGFTISADIDLTRLVLAPSIWGHPYTYRLEVADRQLLIVWGAHPPGYKLVPGESVPNEALLVLRALGDPTRLRLLRLIAAEPRSLQSLASEVKLSLPTVSHHIRELRGAGLIRLEMGGRGRESKYTIRWPSARKAFKQLEEFIQPDSSKASEP
jgi:DNA-binding transcriptional ArsR family regulator